MSTATCTKEPVKATTTILPIYLTHLVHLAAEDGCRLRLRLVLVTRHHPPFLVREIRLGQGKADTEQNQYMSKTNTQTPPTCQVRSTLVLYKVAGPAPIHVN